MSLKYEARVRDKATKRLGRLTKDKGIVRFTTLGGALPADRGEPPTVTVFYGQANPTSLEYDFAPSLCSCLCLN